MAATSSLYGGGGGIKSIQRGSTAIGATPGGTSATATINAVDLAKSFISASFKSGAGSYVTPYYYGAYAYAANSSAGAALTANDTVTVYAGPTATSVSMSTPTCYWEVIEYV